jgi:5-methylcytosine-specific restriction enzyme subunit McrC
VTAPAPRLLAIPEYSWTDLPEDAVPSELGERIHNLYGEQVTVDPPTFKNGRRWRFGAQGSVGYLPLPDGWGIRLVPKTPIANLVRMLEYAYGLDSLKFFDQLSPADTLEEFFSELAGILARRVLDRVRRGLYRQYVPERERLPYLRGRLAVTERLRRPWDHHFACSYEEQLSDVEENQILATTLRLALRSGLCRAEVVPTVRRAYKALEPFVASPAFRAEECVGRFYNRLNADYEPMHALCRFFLDNAAPGHAGGEHSSLPFVVRMDQLFERFVAEWLKRHLPPELELDIQEDVRLSGHGQVSFRIDLVLYRTGTRTPIAVLDTKYKVAEGPSSDDFAQVVTYAQLKGCVEAMLVYPAALPRPLDVGLRDVRIRSLTFDLGGDLDMAGRAGVLSALVALR